MRKYRISKIGVNKSNPLSEHSSFGNSKEFFEGYAFNPPRMGKRFELFTSKVGNCVISTSPVTEIKEDSFVTTYSEYKITKL